MKRVILALLTLALSVGLAFGQQQTQAGFGTSSPSPLVGKNLLVNGNFNVNQRGYTSGGTLASAAFGHDHWFNNSASGNYTFVAAGTGEMAGTQQIGSSLTLPGGFALAQKIEHWYIGGGLYSLSWVGTATCQIVYYNGTTATTVTSLGASPESGVIPTGVTGLVQCTNGTLSNIQLELGGVSTPFEVRPYSTELFYSQRYYQVLSASVRAATNAASQYFEDTVSFVPMRATPSAALVTAGTRSSNLSTVVMIPTSIAQTRFEIQNNATAGDTYALGDLWALTAEF